MQKTGYEVNHTVEKHEQVRCPHCDSHELFEKVKGCLTICLVCFKTIKTDPSLPDRQISWTRVAIAVGVSAGIVAAAVAFSTRTVYEWHVKRQLARPSRTMVNLPATAERRYEPLGDADSRFGGKPWFKGFMDRADSCAPMRSGATPSDDVQADGAHAYIVHADSTEHEYSLFYSDGLRTWVYSSSENECRRAVNAWIWHHTIGQAMGAQ